MVFFIPAQGVGITADKDIGIAVFGAIYGKSGFDQNVVTGTAEYPDVADQVTGSGTWMFRPHGFFIQAYYALFQPVTVVGDVKQVVRRISVDGQVGGGHLIFCIRRI